MVSDAPSHEPARRRPSFAENGVRKLVIAGLVVGAIVAGGLWLTREPSAVDLLAQANPGGRSLPRAGCRCGSTMAAAGAR